MEVIVTIHCFVLTWAMNKTWLFRVELFNPSFWLIVGIYKVFIYVPPLNITKNMRSPISLYKPRLGVI